MRHDDRRWIVGIALVLAAVLAVVGVLALSLYTAATPTARESMRVELFKNALQLAIVVIVGGGIALLYKWVERSWETSREQADLRRRSMERLGDAYRAVREARRVLRACGIRGATGTAEGALTDAQLACYESQMTRISREQLKLEALRVESQHVPLGVDGAALGAEIGAMERYLGRLVTEYERYRPEAEIYLDDVKRLREFTRGSGEDTGPIDPRAGTLQENFVRPYYRALACIVS